VERRYWEWDDKANMLAERPGGGVLWFSESVIIYAWRGCEDAYLPNTIRAWRS